MTMMTDAAPGQAGGHGLNADTRKPALLGGLALLVLIGIFGSWAALTQISAAVIASGQTIVHGKPKLVQSLDGGIMASLLVQNGDIVHAGQVLARLDPNLLATNLDIARSKLAAALALQARLTAEQSGQDRLGFDYPTLPFPLPDTRADEAGQQQIFAARAAVLHGKRAQLAEALLQIDNQVSGISGQISAIEEQIASLTKDITKQTRLVDQGLARQSQLGDLTRNMAVLEGQYAQLTAERARLINSRQDRRLETEQAERAFLEQVVTDLRTTSGQVDELTLEIVTRMEQLDRVDIRAPSEGIVHEIQVTTTGGVLAPGATLMQVIPLDQGMDFELRLDPRSVDDIQPGQAARIVLSAFDAQTTPKLAGKVTMISPGAVVDPQTGQSFYRVEIGVSADELAKLGTLTLIPGMPVEAYLETRSRSVLDYLMEPITHHLQRALREH